MARADHSRLVGALAFLVGCGNTAADSGRDAAAGTAPGNIAPSDAGREGGAMTGYRDAGTDTLDAAEEDDGNFGIGDGGLLTVTVGPGQTGCGPRVCNAATEACCVTNGETVPVCTPLDGCQGGRVILCSGPQSCIAGDSCCALGGASLAINGGSRTECTDSCPGLTVCTASSQCPPGQWCRPDIADFFGYGTCSPSLPDAAAGD